MLAALALSAADKRMLLVAACEPTVRPTGSALDLFARECRTLALRPLSRDETEALLGSVFGDVPNLALLSERIHASAGGRPRECMALAQHLVETQRLSYAGGSWTLPEKLAPRATCRRAPRTCSARASRRSTRAALRLARAQSLAVFDGFTREDYALLDPGCAARGDRRRDRRVARPRRAARRRRSRTRSAIMRCASVLRADMTAAEREAPSPRARGAVRAHRSVRRSRPLRTGSTPACPSARSIACARRFRRSATAPTSRSARACRYAEIGALFERALDAAEQLPRSAREVFELRRWLLALSVACEDRMHQRVAAQLLAQLERDSGLAHYRELAGAESDRSD